ncbi:MAG: multi-sensor signal transduction histidine [Actinobacteria bacterium]|nr:MAG: multi-sensor signal transduction histidine [Actinomycetota bacterium]
MVQTFRSRRAFIAIVVAGIAFAVLTGVALLAYLDMESRTFDSAALHTQHLATADSALVRYWLDQRASDVSIMSTVSRVRTEFPKYLAGDPAAKVWLQDRLETERAMRDYINVSVFTLDGKRVLSFGEHDTTYDERHSATARSVALPTSKMTMTSHRDASGAYHVNWFGPLLVHEAGAELQVTGVIMYEADLQRYLQDVIGPEQEVWPTTIEVRVANEDGVSIARSTSGFAFQAADATVSLDEEVRSSVVLPLKGSSISATVLGADIRSELAWARQSVRLADFGVLLVFVLFAWAYTSGEKSRLGEIAAREAIADALATQDRFLENMSHDLHTPLNSIIGFSALMSRGLAGPVTEEQVRQLAMIESSGKHLLALVTGVLELSKTKAGQEDVRLEWIVATEPVEFVTDVLTPAVAEKRLEWRVNVPEHLELRTDRRLLERILLNLANNAVKFTHAGSVSITAAAINDGEEIAFTVRDTGSGISPESMDFIMKEFMQVRAPGQLKPEGFGLGLTISTTTAALLGGRIEVESIPGKGSAFTLILPRNTGAVT